MNFINKLRLHVYNIEAYMCYSLVPTLEREPQQQRHQVHQQPTYFTSVFSSKIKLSPSKKVYKKAFKK